MMSCENRYRYNAGYLEEICCTLQEDTVLQGYTWGQVREGHEDDGEKAEHAEVIGWHLLTMDVSHRGTGVRAPYGFSEIFCMIACILGS